LITTNYPDKEKGSLIQKMLSHKEKYHHWSKFIYIPFVSQL